MEPGQNHQKMSACQEVPLEEALTTAHLCLMKSLVQAMAKASMLETQGPQLPAIEWWGHQQHCSLPPWHQFQPRRVSLVGHLVCLLRYVVFRLELCANPQELGVAAAPDGPQELGTAAAPDGPASC